MRFFTVDLGEHMGWARADDRGPPTYGTEHLPRCGEDYGVYGSAFQNFLKHQFHHVAKPDLVGFASPLVYGPTQWHSQRILLGMAMILETTCIDSGVATVEDNESAMRGYFLAPGPVPNKSADIKKAVMARCGELGWPVTDSHSADALCALDFMRAQVLKAWPSAAERSGLFGKLA